MPKEKFNDKLKKCDILKRKLLQFSDYLNLFDDENINDTLLTELELRFEQAQPLLELFDEIQTSIEIESSDENIDSHIKDREAYTKSYFEIIALGKTKLNKFKNELKDALEASVTSLPPQVQQNVVYQNSMKLPLLELPKFDGGYEGWLEFRDTFESLIHTRIDLPNIHKFHYLRASLCGSAAQVIKSLEFSSQNYEIAWYSLCERYNNTRVLVYNHVKSLFNIETLQRESALQLRKIIDHVNKHLRSLKTLNQPTESWDTLVVYLVTTKLDHSTSREWEQRKDSDEIPTLNDLITFLKNRADMLETLELNKCDKKQFKSYDSKTTRSFVASSMKCLMCKKDSHFIQSCKEFLKLSVKDRIDQVKKSRLCFNCLRSGHSVNVCKSTSCKQCARRHSTLLHIAADNVSTAVLSQEEPPSARSRLENANNAPVSLSASHSHICNQILLSTVQVEILDSKRNVYKIRALLDAGSQSSFMTERLCQRLALPKSDISMMVGGLNNLHSEIKSKCTVRINSQFNNFYANISCLVLPQITGNIPNFTIDASSLQIPGHIKLADPSFGNPGEIDLLIGADWFWKLICIGQVKLASGPVLQKTRLGWIVSGPINTVNASNDVFCNFSKDVLLDQQLTRFWQIEDFPDTRHFSKEEEQCEALFKQTTKRDSDGRFVVTIPLKHDINKLGDSRTAATRRFTSLERKLKQNDLLRQRYIDFMEEYLRLGHMSRVIDNNDSHYYLPHHGVLKEESTTTKLRVVYDGSATTSSGWSLNALQSVGPTIQSDLWSIIVRFRKHKYVVSGDIEKMYRQVLISPEQRALQRILWRSDPNKPIDTYELNTVTYGTASAAFLSIRCLQELANEIETKYPDISFVIKNDFYVDDLLTGADTLDQTIRIAEQVSHVLKKGCFNLRKWVSNDPEIVLKLQDCESSTKSVDFNKEYTKTLGLIWLSQVDMLCYVIADISDTKVTKRSILSNVAQIFDPLGLLSPCTVSAKLLLQKLWSEKLTWDESIPAYLHKRWLDYRDSLKSLNTIRIPRHVIGDNPINVQMHGFSDASQNAYGACLYIRTVNSNSEVNVRLLCAKTKVAPVKLVTIPRLELCAAMLLSKLAKEARNALKLDFDQFTYWTDSTIVLGWLKISPNLLQTFVANRITQILEHTSICEWRHVPTHVNPADLLSRGITPSELKDQHLWWTGPDYLYSSEAYWPVQPQVCENPPEMKGSSISMYTTSSKTNDIFDRFSTLSKLVRVHAYCLRFLKNIRASQGNKIRGALLASELRHSLLSLVKIAQRNSFPQEIKRLTLRQKIDVRSKLLNLNPFIDDDGIFRVGGRLENSKFSYAKKHPAILCPRHKLTKLLFKEEHVRLLHAGPQLLLSHIRNSFWPIQGRNLARKIVHECIRCFRENPKIIVPLMGNLPESRTQQSPPFYTSGVDYAGPFNIKDRKGRGCKITKCYIGLFVCFSTKAIHMELVSDLTSESFIAALRRFVSRRGKPHTIYSDNGTTFVGANTELSKFIKFNASKLTDKIQNEGISWKFIPARSPHFGGIWEAGIKSAKHHLKRVAGNELLTFEELYTLIVQVESVLNSCPITPLSYDPADLNPLTPAHFLIGRPLISLVDPDLTNYPINRLSRFQHIQQMNRHFWSRWSKEYISDLQLRTKWKQSYGTLKEGALVLIKEDNLPPLKWQLGRIISTHPGSDSVVRVASIFTRSGVIKRASSKICPLPIEPSE